MKTLVVIGLFVVFFGGYGLAVFFYNKREESRKSRSTKTKKQMPLAIAIVFVSGLDVLRVDRLFDHSEPNVTWSQNGVEVASGFFASDCQIVTIEETERFLKTKFENDEALRFEGLGRYGNNYPKPVNSLAAAVQLLWF